MRMAMHWLIMNDAAIAIVAQCGVLNAWANGLRRDKINMLKKYGYNRNARVPCAGHRFAY